VWSDHFRVSDDDIIHGLTAIGRVTVTLLRMNTQPQLNARRWWRTLQLFP